MGWSWSGWNWCQWHQWRDLSATQMRDGTWTLVVVVDTERSGCLREASRGENRWNGLYSRGKNREESKPTCYQERGRRRGAGCEVDQSPGHACPSQRSLHRSSGGREGVCSLEETRGWRRWCFRHLRDFNLCNRGICWPRRGARQRGRRSVWGTWVCGLRKIQGKERRRSRSHRCTEGLTGRAESATPTLLRGPVLLLNY